MEILENREQWAATFREGWLAHYRRTGKIDWSLYPQPRNSVAPSGPGVDVDKCRLMLISSAGGYLPGQQQPFDAANPLGDYGVRFFPSSSRLDALAFSHEHYDQTAVNQDRQVLLPLGHLEDLVSEGTIGELAPSTASFMGYQPDVTRVIDETIPPIVKAALSEQVNAAILVPS